MECVTLWSNYQWQTTNFVLKGLDDQRSEQHQHGTEAENAYPWTGFAQHWETRQGQGFKGEDEAASADKETSAEKKDGGEKPEEEEPIIYKMPTYLPLPVDDDGNHKSVRIPDSASPFKEVDEDFFEKAKKVSESFFRKLHIKRRLETRLSNGFFHLFISKNWSQWELGHFKNT